MAVDPNLLTGLGCVLSIFLTATGSAIASGHAGIYAIRGPGYKYFIPIIQAGVLGIYGILISIFLVFKFQKSNANTTEESIKITQADGYRYLSAGLSVGLACLASGWGMARFLQQLNNCENNDVVVASAVTTSSSNGNGDNNNNNNNTTTEPLLGNRRRLTSESIYGKQSFVKTILAMIFLEAIGLYGLIVALVLIFR